MIIFVCDSRDYHAMDWFHVVKEIAGENAAAVATDISDTDPSLSIVRERDKIIFLFDIKKYLFKRQSRRGDLWRNIIKLASTPVQIRKLRMLAKNQENIFHAHSMYYIFLCWLARIKFIATPMGSDVLVRPDESAIYRYMTKKSLLAADIITVDSEKLQHKILQLCGAPSQIIQNGIDVAEIEEFGKSMRVRDKIVSIRGFYPNYQIEKVLASRKNMQQPPGIIFIYPFFEEGYRAQLRMEFIETDTELGRLGKADLYDLLWQTKLVVSIPESDSSPRSVYEAIFCGCAVAVSYSLWVDALPACMKKRIIVSDLERSDWFENAITQSEKITSEKYVPSQEALDTFDQIASMTLVCKNIYKLNL